jgi:hypothetical protein
MHYSLHALDLLPGCERLNVHLDLDLSLEGTLRRV